MMNAVTHTSPHKPDSGLGGRRHWLGLAAIFVPVIGWSGQDAGSQLRQFQDETVRRIAPDRAPTAPAPEFRPSAPTNASSTGPRVLVSAFVVHGTTRFSDTEIAAVLAPYTGKELASDGIHAAADALQSLYRERGYFASRVYIPPQALTNTIRLDVYEGYLDAAGIEVVNQGNRIRTDVVKGILDAHLNDGQPIQRAAYERALLLAEDLPGITTVSTLYPGAQVGTARLRTVISDLPALAGNVDVDNFGNRSTGQNRIGATVYLNSPSQVGDQLVGRFVTSGHRSQYAYVTYLRPISPLGTRLGASLDHFRYDADFITNVGYSSGKATDFRVYLTHPIVRSRHGNLNLRTDLSHLSLDDRNDLGIDARRHINTLTLALQGDDDHPWLTTGLTTFNLSATAGHVDIQGNAAYRSSDASTAETAGGFARLNLHLERLTRLSSHWALNTRLNAQWANSDLDSSQRFYLGGPLSVAGYPTGEASGDQGAELSAELRRDLTVPWANTLQIGLFYQLGQVRVHKNIWPGWQGTNPNLRNDYSLRTVGISALATVGDKWVVRGLIGRQVSRNPVLAPSTGRDTDGRDSRHRVWLQVIRYL